jgi:hypothetical protein
MDKSTAMMYQILTIYPSFPAETRQWARKEMALAQMNEGGANSEANQLMRQWWEHNKDAVLSRQYDKATWLPSASEEIPVRPTDTSPAASSQPTPTQPPPPTHASEVQPDSETGIPWWIYAVIVLSLGLIVGLWYFLRSKK